MSAISKKYLLAALYNAPDAIGNYYTSLASHDHTADRETLSHSCFRFSPVSCLGRAVWSEGLPLCSPL